jgi:tripartite-type tricarboxylate transporter receptor subunit TctC
MAFRPLRRAFAATLIFVAALDAAAQVFPSKPVRIVIGFPPGGGIDIVARILAPRLTEALGQPVLVENRPGANGVVGMDLVAKAAPDGHTVMLGTLGTFSVNPSFYPNLPFNAETAFAPLTQLASVAFIVYANPSLPAKSIGELIAHARANPGKINFSSSGNGGLPHLAGEMFGAAAGLSMVHVPYKGSAPSIADVMGGQVQITFEAAAIGLQHIKSGKLRGLATTSARRLAFAPDIPTVAETLPGFEVVNWYGMAVPAGTPREAINRLHAELVKAMALPDVREKMVAQGTDPVGSTPEAFGAFVKAESAKWIRVIRQANIKPD